MWFFTGFLEYVVLLEVTDFWMIVKNKCSYSKLNTLSSWIPFCVYKTRDTFKRVCLPAGPHTRLANSCRSRWISTRSGFYGACIYGIPPSSIFSPQRTNKLNTTIYSSAGTSWSAGVFFLPFGPMGRNGANFLPNCFRMWQDPMDRKLCEGISLAPGVGDQNGAVIHFCTMMVRYKLLGQ